MSRTYDNPKVPWSASLRAALNPGMDGGPQPKDARTAPVRSIRSGAERRAPKLRLLAALLLGLLSTPTAKADPGAATAAFAEANQLFEAGDPAAASSAYESLVEQGHLSAELLYNLGATKHRLGQSGEGALWMRRALVLEPGMPEAGQSLAFLRSHLAFFEFAERPLDRFLGSLPPAFGPWSVSLCVWGGLVALASAFLVPRLRPNRSALAALGIALLAVALAAFLASRHRREHLAVENFATVVLPETAALAAPAADAKPVVELPPGSEVRLLQAAGPWSYVDIPGELRGWVRSEAVVPVWPIPPAASPAP